LHHRVCAEAVSCDEIIERGFVERLQEGQAGGEIACPGDPAGQRIGAWDEQGELGAPFQPCVGLDPRAAVGYVRDPHQRAAAGQRRKAAGRVDLIALLARGAPAGARGDLRGDHLHAVHAALMRENG
jgi:hypothetical protein